MKNAGEEKKVFHSICRELLVIHDEHPLPDQLCQFAGEDILAQLRVISEDIFKKWCSWKENEQMNADAVQKISEPSIDDGDKDAVMLVVDKSQSEYRSIDDEKQIKQERITINLLHEPRIELCWSDVGAKDFLPIRADEQNTNDIETTGIEKAIISNDRNDEKIRNVHEIDMPTQNLQMNQDSHKTKMMLMIPNAMVNTWYSEKVSHEGGQFSKITKIEGAEEAGVCYDSETQCLSGTPPKPGEFRFKVTYLLTTGGSGSAYHTFVVNHDPKSLWKDIPSDTSVKFWKKDEDAQEEDGQNDWKLVAASKRGRSHAHEGKCRDDDFALIGKHPQQWHILAVSDGAGSCQYSREGAKIAVQESSRLLAEKLTEHNDALFEAVSAWEQAGQSDEAAKLLRQKLYSVFSQAVYAAIKTIHETSKKEESTFRDFYATLLLAAHRDIEGRHFVVGYWIGDGGMAVYQEGLSVTLLGQADSGEYAGQTRFLDREANNGEDIMQRISFASFDTMTALFLLTDGITDPIFETDHRLGQNECWDQFWQKTIQNQLSAESGKTAANLMNWLSFWSPGNHDDRTIALLYKGNELS
jgi:hypothetical protein